MIIYAGGEVSMEIGNAKWSHRLGKSDIENLCLGLFSENFIATPPIFEPLPFLLRFPAGPCFVDRSGFQRSSAEGGSFKLISPFYFLICDHGLSRLLFAVPSPQQAQEPEPSS
jgi:hypothetical protein